MIQTLAWAALLHLHCAPFLTAAPPTKLASGKSQEQWLEANSSAAAAALLLLFFFPQMLHDTDAGLGCAAALALRTLAHGHPANQTRIGQEPGAVAGLVAMALGQQQQGALQAMAAAALKRLADNHPVNRAKIRRESSSFCEYVEYVEQQYCAVGFSVSWGSAESGEGAVEMVAQQQQRQQQQLERWRGMLTERRQQHVCVV
jgi:hypothetical protein